MKKIELFFAGLLILFVLSAASASAKITKVACVGNSITYGANIANRDKNSYPAQLQYYLGSSYEVRNFGVSGRTLLSNGDLPYAQTNEYKQSLEFMPDIVFIKLGTNDSKPQNRIHLANYKDDYRKLINSYRSLPSHPRIVLIQPLHCFLPEPYDISDNVMQSQISPIIRSLAYEQNLETIDLYRMFGDQCMQHIFPDRLHPSSIGAGMIAKRLASYVTVKKEAQRPFKDIALKEKGKFNFHGYSGVSYDMNGVTCLVVSPRRPAEGNPWIWRARFWGHEPQTDIALLEQGFYVAYCDVADLYGAKKAVERWNSFYRIATKAGLNRKVVLEGLSRGGLIVYNWAVNNLNKVAAIYADAPVLDFKSWPMGKGSSKGSPDDTKQMMAAYGFNTEEEALNFRNNPIDAARKLAKSGIPILHIVGDADTTVPVSENTEPFAKKILSCGGNIEVIHKPGVEHHPHSLFNPTPIVEFVLRSTHRYSNACTQAVPGNEYRSGAGWKEGNEWHSINEDLKVELKKHNVEWLFLGNSITQGWGGERELVTYKPGKEAADNVFGKNNWATAGISGDRTQNLLWRISNDDYSVCRPKYCVIAIGVNNILGGSDTPEEIAEGIIACAAEGKLRLPDTKIILLGLLPTGTNADSPQREAYDKIRKVLSRKTTKGVAYTDPTSWFVKPDGQLNGSLYSGDAIHLSSHGYELLATKLKELFGSSTNK